MANNILNSVSQKWIRLCHLNFLNSNLFRISDLVLRISRHYGPAVVAHSGAPVANFGYSVANFGYSWAHFGAPQAQFGAPNPPQNLVFAPETRKLVLFFFFFFKKACRAITFWGWIQLQNTNRNYRIPAGCGGLKP